MIVEEFRYRFVSEINKWMRARKIDPIKYSDLPQIGLMIFDKDTLIAVGFLRKIEGSLCMIDSMAANPEVSKESREEGLEMLTSALIMKAASLDMKGIISHTKLPVIEDRAHRHGFKTSEEKILFLNLEDI